MVNVYYQLLKESDISGHQAYSINELGEKPSMITSREDSSSHPIRNTISITEKGIRATQKLIEFVEIVMES